MSFYEESDMHFDPLFNSAEFQSFYIEKSELYQNVKSDSVKSVEFVVVKNQDFYFIEAKSSFPFTNPNEIKREEEDLYSKLHHTLDLFIARNLGIKKHSADSFPKNLGNAEVLDKKLAEHKLYFYLIMNGKFKEDWCENVLIILNDKLTPLRKIWDIEVKVITEDNARELNFIQ